MILLGKKDVLEKYISCNESNYFIWKWQQPNFCGISLIRDNSTIEVKKNEVAVIMYTDGDNVVKESIEGPCEAIINTDNLPFHSVSKGVSYFNVEIYYINLANIFNLRFGIPYFDCYDAQNNINIPVAVRGNINFKINDYNEFITLNDLNTFNINNFQKNIRNIINRVIKDIIIRIIDTYEISIFQLESMIYQISENVEFELNEQLYKLFGTSIISVSIDCIEIDKSSSEYNQFVTQK